MHAVVLAAGDGSRLHPLTSDRPKALLELCGRPIINYVLDALSAAGVGSATIITGYRAGQMTAALAGEHPCGMRLELVENSEHLLGNARSLWCARDAVMRRGESGFVLAMADHLVEPALVKALVAAAGDRCRLAVDRVAADDPSAEGATRALVAGGRVTALGKELSSWNALDTGTFWCTPSLFDLMTPDLRDGEAAAVFAAIAQRGELDAVDVTGLRWVDIDTLDDVRRAEALLMREQARFHARPD